MPRILSSLLLLLSLVLGLSALHPARASEIPRALADWLLSPPRDMAPLPSPPPPTQAEVQIAELFENQDPVSTKDRFPAPPPVLRRLWESEYAQQYQSQDKPVLQLLPPPEVAAQVKFAAGAIVFTVPQDWAVAEADHFRHVRLYITPQPSSPRAKAKFEGAWVSYHVMPPAEDLDDQLRRFMARRLADTLPESAELHSEQRLRIAEHEALQREFQTESTGSQPRFGYQLVISTDWGIVEWQVRYTDDSLRQMLDRMIEGMRISRPQRPRPEITSATAQAEGILGTWKAERARLEFSGQGHVSLIYDRERRQELGTVHMSRPARRIQGSYQAHADVLYVTWDDGSRLNLRYDSADGELLLTDHLGRVSQLSRLFE